MTRPPGLLRRAFVVLLLWTLGCAGRPDGQSWTRQGSSQAVLAVDLADCRSQAEVAGRNAAFDGRHVIAAAAREALGRCMAAKGWQPSSGSEAAVAQGPTSWPVPPTGFRTLPARSPDRREFSGPDGMLLSLTFQPGEWSQRPYPLPAGLRLYDRGQAGRNPWALGYAPAGDPPAAAFGAYVPWSGGRLVVVAVAPLPDLTGPAAPGLPMDPGRQSFLEDLRRRLTEWLAPVRPER